MQATWLVALALVAVAPLHAAQGDLDTSFGTDGKLFQPGVFQWNDVAQQADGRIVIVVRSKVAGIAVGSCASLPASKIRG